MDRWRTLGPAAGTRLAVRLAARSAASPARRAWLRLRPLSVGPQQVARALGGLTPVQALRGPALEAMPTVARFERALPELPAPERDQLLAVADSAATHVFDLLGSGPTQLGAEIDWRSDFRHGRRWPLDHASRVRISYGDGSDIKIPWELSRFQHLPVLAAAHLLTGRSRYLEEIGAQLDSWIAANPVEYGPNWASTMEVAIRASNWVAALAVCAEAAAGQPWLERAVGSLLLHGRFIRRHLDWAPVRNNHHLAHLVGLLLVAGVFAGSPEGRSWAGLVARRLGTEIEHQVRGDGCAHEASIPYHRLVAELFVCGGQAAAALVEADLPAGFDVRVARMLDFTGAYTRPGGLAPHMGDGDDGRFLPLGDYGRADPRSHLHLFAQAGRPAPAPGGSAAFAAGGWYVMRCGELVAVVRCGDVGVGGLGYHAHNDQLSFELSLGEQPLVVDPGTYVYTADLDARALFRSTAFHSTMRIGGREQNELDPARPFALPDHTRAEALEWSAGGERARFVGRHHGFERLDPPAGHERRLELDGAQGRLTVTDVVRSRGSHALEWTFPLPPGSRVELLPAGARVQLPGAALELTAAGVEVAVEDGWYSPRYGVREPALFLRLRREGQPGADHTTITLRALPR